MKIYYMDCSSGMSGDMFIGALLDLGLDFHYLKRELLKLNLSGYKIKQRKVNSNGIRATKFDVIDISKKKYRSYKTIIEIIDQSSLNTNVKTISKKILDNLATAEAHFHNVTIAQVHFHEIGAIDTIIDIVGAAIGIDKLKIKNFFCNEINLGNGKVMFSHGIFDIPAPATAFLLKNFKTYKNGTKELTTPTGAAIVNVICKQEKKLFVKKRVGNGAGSFQLPWPNVVKIIEGETMELIEEENDLIETNIDNMSPELYDYVFEKLFENGALDVFLSPIQMKKTRPGTVLHVLCKNEDIGKMLNIIFCETTTLGVRIQSVRKVMTNIAFKKIKTRFGFITVKIGKIGNSIVNVMPEFNECKNLAKKKNIALKVIYYEIMGKLYKK